MPGRAFPPPQADSRSPALKSSKRKMTTFQVNPYVERIVMPENLRVGLMVAKQRKKCGGGCNDDFPALAIGQSSFHVPPPLAVRQIGDNKFQRIHTILT